MGKPKPIDERKADDKVQRIYHEMKQTLRMNGIHSVLQHWASYPIFFPMMWNAIRPNAETIQFENAASELRRQAILVSKDLPKLSVFAQAKMGESQAFRFNAAIQLYHFIDPKLLLVCSAVFEAIEHGAFKERTDTQTELEMIQPGIPSLMHPMEVIPDKPEDDRVRPVLKDIRKALSLPDISSEYRTLALWPDYFVRFWPEIKPILEHPAYKHNCLRLKELSRSLVYGLPYPIPLSRHRIEEAGDNANEILNVAIQYEQLLSGLIIQMTLIGLEQNSAETLGQPLFPPLRMTYQKSALGEAA